MFDISRRLIEFNAGRLPDLVQVKFTLMSESFFRFYRGSNHLFYEDLVKVPGFPDSPASWISGDLHLENFGTFKSDNRQVYFDLNDFDEGVLAPALWEAVKMVSGIFIGFDSLRIEPRKALHMAQGYLRSYSDTLAAGKARYVEPNTATGIVRSFLETVAKRKQKDILRKRTIRKKDRLGILLDDPRHFELEAGLKERLFAHIDDWLKNDGRSPYNYRVIDAIFRLAGTGSVGQRRYALLLRSQNKSGEKYLLLDMKESKPSSLEPLTPIAQPAWISSAERVVSIQRRMQNHSPALLSTTVFDGRAFVIQEMQPTKDSFDFNLLKKEYRHMYQVITAMGMLTASSQLRSVGRQGSCSADALIYLGGRTDWQTPVLDYGADYAATMKKYFYEFKNDLKAGLLKNNGGGEVDPADGLALTD